MFFKQVKRKIKKDGKTITVKVFKEGIEGTGHTLPYSCGFCGEAHFRSRRQRNQHTNFCPK